MGQEVVKAQAGGYMGFTRAGTAHEHQNSKDAGELT